MDEQASRKICERHERQLLREQIQMAKDKNDKTMVLKLGNT